MVDLAQLFSSQTNLIFKKRNFSNTFSCNFLRFFFNFAISVFLLSVFNLIWINVPSILLPFRVCFVRRIFWLHQTNCAAKMKINSSYENDLSD